MNALFALALFASSSWAGVVMPVESGVAPAGPSVGGVPVLAPSGGSLSMPVPGGADLRGALPMLPAPVPGLLAPALNFFVGEGPRAAAVQAEAAASPAAPGAPVAPASVRRRAAADATPALPGKPSPGASTLAISAGRTADAAALRAGPSSPLAGTSALEHARPEAAAGLGRSFFDQSAEKRGTLADPSARDRRPASGSRGGTAGASDASADSPARTFEGPLAARGRLAPSGAGFALGAGHAAPSIGELELGTRGETLHDAVAGAPAGAAGGAAVFFRSASPNGELAASAGAAALPLPGAPRPLALDLSGEGLIVRVRAALSGAAAAVPAAAPSARLPGPGPSTALLERGGMLEAFSVAADYAARSGLQAVPAPQASAAGAARAPARSVPSPEPFTAPLWWAWFALPLFVAAVRGLL